MPTITDLYVQLFGKEHLKDGDVIEMSEHGRAGGVSTGSGFKNTKTVEEKIIIDEVSSTTIYIGRALVGSSTASAVWQIKKISVSGVVSSFLLADGDDKYNNVWDDRASLSYS